MTMVYFTGRSFSCVGEKKDTNSFLVCYVDLASVRVAVLARVRFYCTYYKEKLRHY